MKLSIVILVWNEADVIEEVVKDYYSKIICKSPGSELIVAEDGSDDGTKEILTKLATELPIKLIMGEKRKGYRTGGACFLLIGRAPSRRGRKYSGNTSVAPPSRMFSTSVE